MVPAPTDHAVEYVCFLQPPSPSLRPIAPVHPCRHCRGRGTMTTRLVAVNAVLCMGTLRQNDALDLSICRASSPSTVNQVVGHANQYAQESQTRLTCLVSQTGDMLG